jgi:hypothetical protein
MNINSADVQAVLKPSVKRVVWTFVIAVILLIIININLIILQATSGTLLAQSAVQDSIAQQLQNWTSAPLLNTATLVVFWVCVGLIAYSVIYAIYSVATEAQNEVVVEEEYVNRGKAEKRLKGPAFQLGLVAALIVLGIISLRFLIPIWNGWFEAFVVGIRTTPLTSIGYLVASLLGLAVNIYMFEVLINWTLYLE